MSLLRKVLNVYMSVDKGRQGGAMAPPGFSHTLSFISQISKILPFLEVNTGSIFIAPPEKFSADALERLFSIGAKKSTRGGGPT